MKKTYQNPRFCELIRYTKIDFDRGVVLNTLWKGCHVKCETFNLDLKSFLKNDLVLCSMKYFLLKMLFNGVLFDSVFSTDTMHII